MSTVLPPPGAAFQELSLDDLNDRFWAIVTEELEGRSASLSEVCEDLLRSYVTAGAQRFLEAPAAERSLILATQKLRELIGALVATAAAQQKLAATAGGTSPMLIIDQEVFQATLQKAKNKGWSFWPFS